MDYYKSVAIAFEYDDLATREVHKHSLSPKTQQNAIRDTWCH